jgi:cystathionine beta-synthase/cysteine synthase A
MKLSDTIGNTPLIELTKLKIPHGIRIFVKLEYMNPSGSIKDRIVNFILSDAEKNGIIHPGSTIVENTSGNTGASIAMFAALRGYKAILTMPDKVSLEKQNALKAYGAEIIVCPTEATVGSPEHYVEKAHSIHRTIPESFMLNQYNNPLNIEAHFSSTGPEIWEQTNGKIDAFIASGSTGGTISGIGRFLKNKNNRIQNVFLDPKGSVYYTYFKKGVISQHDISLYHVEGVGEDHLAKCMDFSIIDDAIQFDDRSAFMTCHELAKKEGLLCGGSSGANVFGCLEYAKKLVPPASIVTVLPDSGIKYISKIYNPAWLKQHNLIE